jgi:DNA-directed RNA polymerase specialized sigma24 family protein
MDEHDLLAERFEEHRTHLRTVAYRMLGSISEADDAVQEAWLRLRGRANRQVSTRLLTILRLINSPSCYPLTHTLLAYWRKL